MNFDYAYRYFAQAYGADAYSSGSYQVVQGSSTGSAPGGSGPLANTGYDVIVPVSLGISIVVASVILLAKKAVRAKKRI